MAAAITTCWAHHKGDGQLGRPRRPPLAVPADPHALRSAPERAPAHEPAHSASNEQDDERHPWHRRGVRLEVDDPDGERPVSQHRVVRCRVILGRQAAERRTYIAACPTPTSAADQQESSLRRSAPLDEQIRHYGAGDGDPYVRRSTVAPGAAPHLVRLGLVVIVDGLYLVGVLLPYLGRDRGSASRWIPEAMAAPIVLTVFFLPWVTIGSAAFSGCRFGVSL